MLSTLIYFSENRLPNKQINIQKKIITEANSDGQSIVGAGVLRGCGQQQFVFCCGYGCGRKMDI